MNIDKHGFNNVIRLGLERIEGMLEYLGRPDRKLNFVHVAGTNGKGSVCAFIESALSAAGMLVGKFTSPNLIKVNERITVGGDEIADCELEEVLTSAQNAADEVSRRLSEEPTQFEIWCAAAMLYFARRKCDIVVLEVGLGGEFDATNVIEAPMLSVICHIDIDHTAYLGSTLREIANAKCGIIKPTAKIKTVISSSQYPEVMSVIKERAEAAGSTAFLACEPEVFEPCGIYENVRFEKEKIRLALGGYYQIENAKTAYFALKAMGIDEKYIKKGFETARHRARFEEIEDGVIFDGGHNPDGVRALDFSLKRYFKGEKLTVIYACMADKDIKSVLDLLKSEEREFIFTSVAGNERAMKADALCEFAKNKCGVIGKAVPDLQSAIALAKKSGHKVIICGSLYLYEGL